MIVERKRYGSRGQGSLIRYDDSPNWVSCYYVRGKEYRESTGSADLKTARRFHKQKLDEIALDRQGTKRVITPMAARVTVNQLLDDLKADIELRELKSSYKLRSHTKAVREYFGGLRALDVTSATIDKYIEKLRAAGKAPATVNRYTQVLGAAFKLAVERKKLTEAPMIRKLSEAGNARQGFFERDQVEAVVAALPDYLQDMVRFAHATGWRKSEIIGLRWDMVDTAARTITLPTTKNGRPRCLSLAGDVAEIITRREQARLVERGGDVRVADLIFHRQGQSVGDFKKSWHVALVKAGLTHQEKAADGTVVTVHDRLFHDLRRTAARNLVRSGVREGVAMAVTGHRTRSVFDRYAIVADDDIRGAMEKVSSRID